MRRTVPEDDMVRGTQRRSMRRAICNRTAESITLQVVCIKSMALLCSRSRRQEGQSRPSHGQCKRQVRIGSHMRCLTLGTTRRHVLQCQPAPQLGSHALQGQCNSLCGPMKPTIDPATCGSSTTGAAIGCSGAWRASGCAGCASSCDRRDGGRRVVGSWKGCRPLLSKFGLRHTHTSTNTHPHAQKHIQTPTHTHTHRQAHAHAHTYTQTLTHTDTDAHTHTRIHTHTHRRHWLLQDTRGWNELWIPDADAKPET